MSVRKVKAFASEKVVFEDSTIPAFVIVENGTIQEVICGCIEGEKAKLIDKYPGIEIEYFGEKVLMPGLVDSHVHLNEPGRTEWEGFQTGTQAAAAGGVTTVVDMPLNSLPPTTTLKALEIKKVAARGNVFVDVGFWGGVVPGNVKELKPMINAGVRGFKCFLCPSGEEYPHVARKDVEEALEELKDSGSVILFHAELEESVNIERMDPKCYETFLKTRPPSMEIRAIKMVSELCQNSKVKCHIVHLSASDALELVVEAKKNGAPLTAETCHHYLTLTAEEIPQKSTQFKCCPPIRDSKNREILWAALKNGILDMVVSDHSPCTPELKTDDFIQSWGGISSLQFGLPLIWTQAEIRGLDFNDISRLVSAKPAEMCGLASRKGKIQVGLDADFVIWSPDEEITITKSEILYKNKISPYEGRILKGKVSSTILRGEYIFKDGKVLEKPVGRLIPDEEV